MPYIALSLAMVLWASSFVALKVAFRDIDPLVVIFGRMLVACLCFLPLLPRIRRFEYRRGDWRWLLLMSVFEPCLYFIFEAEALLRTSAAQAGMITAVLPLLVALLARVLLTEHVSRATLQGALVAATGVIWLSAAGEVDEHAPAPMLGNFLQFLAMVCSAGYVLTVKYLSQRYSPWLLTAMQAGVGSLFFFPVLFFPSTALDWPPSTPSILAVIYLGGVVTLGAYGLYNYGTSRIPVNQSSAFVNLIPVFAALFGVLLLGERLTPWQWPACALVLVGVWVGQRRRKAEPGRP